MGVREGNSNIVSDILFNPRLENAPIQTVLRAASGTTMFAVYICRKKTSNWLSVQSAFRNHIYIRVKDGHGLGFPMPSSKCRSAQQ